MADNAGAAILTQYRRVLDALVQHADSVVGGNTLLAVAFLVVEVALVVPCGMLYLAKTLSGVLRLRIARMAIAVAVPKPVLEQLGRQPVSVGREHEGAAAYGAASVPGPPRLGGGEVVRALATRALGEERVSAARDLVMARRSRQRTQKALEHRLLLPVAGWGALVAACYAATLVVLGKIPPNSLEPRRVAALGQMRLGEVIVAAQTGLGGTWAASTEGDGSEDLEVGLEWSLAGAFDAATWR